LWMNVFLWSVSSYECRSCGDLAEAYHVWYQHANCTLQAAFKLTMSQYPEHLLSLDDVRSCWPVVRSEHSKSSIVFLYFLSGLCIVGQRFIDWWIRMLPSFAYIFLLLERKHFELLVENQTATTVTKLQQLIQRVTYRKDSLLIHKSIWPLAERSASERKYHTSMRSNVSRA